MEILERKISIKFKQSIWRIRLTVSPEVCKRWSTASASKNATDPAVGTKTRMKKKKPQHPWSRPKNSRLSRLRKLKRSWFQPRNRGTSFVPQFLCLKSMASATSKVTPSSPKSYHNPRNKNYQLQTLSNLCLKLRRIRLSKIWHRSVFQKLSRLPKEIMTPIRIGTKRTKRLDCQSLIKP